MSLFVRIREALRDWAIHLLLDLLCTVVKQDQRYELIIEPDNGDMIAVLKEANDKS